VVESFRRVLARIQSEYDFYIRFQENPVEALKGYDLSPDERAVLTDPARLGSLLTGLGDAGLDITITIVGTHDWFNPTNVQPPQVSPPTVSLSPPPPPPGPPPPPPGPPPPPPGPPPPPPGPPPPPPGPPPPPPGPPPPGPPPGEGGRLQQIEVALDAIAVAATEAERTVAVLGLMQVIG
jgi:hypothetical protein